MEDSSFQKISDLMEILRFLGRISESMIVTNTPENFTRISDTHNLNQIKLLTIIGIPKPKPKLYLRRTFS